MAIAKALKSIVRCFSCKTSNVLVYTVYFDNQFFFFFFFIILGDNCTSVPLLSLSPAGCMVPLLLELFPILHYLKRNNRADFYYFKIVTMIWNIITYIPARW